MTRMRAEPYYEGVGDWRWMGLTIGERSLGVARLGAGKERHAHSHSQSRHFRF